MGEQWTKSKTVEQTFTHTSETEIKMTYASPKIPAMAFGKFSFSASEKYGYSWSDKESNTQSETTVDTETMVTTFKAGFSTPVAAFSKATITAYATMSSGVVKWKGTSKCI